MFPLQDNTPRKHFPFVNYAIIALTIYIFFLQLTAPDFERFVNVYGFIPAAFKFSNPSTYPPVLYSMFLHGGFFHIISNLWFLRVFGDNVEDVFGHIKYLLFYILGGVVAVLAQYMVAPHVTVPLVGASGAISAVAGAYFVYFKNSRVKSLVTLVFFWTVIDLSAAVVLGYWFIVQVVSGLGSLTMVGDANEGGVAFFAHVGGFAFGYLTARVLGMGRSAQSA